MTPEYIKKQYDYLDKLHISGWLWELIRRNEKYKALITIESRRVLTFKPSALLKEAINK
jgi:hypothetical protein